MESFFGFLKIIVICGAALFALLLILIAIPQTKMRALLLEILGWTSTAASAVAVISPVDFVPDFVPVAGQLDDVAYIIVGIISAFLAYKQRKDRTSGKFD